MKNFFIRLWNSPVMMTWGNLSAKSSSLFLLLPLILSQFESEDIVVWYVFTTIISLQMLINFGFTPTLSRLISYAHGGASLSDIQKIVLNNRSVDIGQKAHDSVAIATIFSTSTITFLGLAILAFLLSASIGTWLVSGALDASNYPNEAWISWWVVLLIASISLYGDTYVSLLQGIDRIALVQRVQMFFSLAAVLSAMTALVLDQSIMVVVLSFYSWNLVNVVINYFYTKAVLRKKYIRLNIDLKFLKEVIWPNSWRSGIGVLFSLGLIQLSALVVTKLAAPAVAATYMLSIQLIRAASSFSQAPFYSKLPSLGKLFVQGDKETLIAVARSGMKKSVFIFVLIVLALSIFGDFILSWMGSNAGFPDLFFWFVLSLAFLFERIGVLYLQLYTVTGDVIWHKANGLTGIFIIILSVSLFNSFGVIALPISMLIAYALFFTIYTSLKSYQAFGQLIAAPELVILLGFFVAVELVFINLVGFGYV